MSREFLRIVDSHTAGEATRVVCQGGPFWNAASPLEWRRILAEHYDHYRRAIIEEPRGHPALVGAWLGPPCSREAVASVVFFNNVGYLGMCVHGTLGLAVTLRYLGQVEADTFQIDTPVGLVSVQLHSDTEASVTNVPSYCYRTNVPVDAFPYGTLMGDIAWGGNWFFLVDEPREHVGPENLERLTALACRIRRALEEQAIRGANGAPIDHVALFGPSNDPSCHSRNFVLCPGGQYDRSPCGTGTSAKLACLAQRGLLAEGVLWRQQGIRGTYFDAWYRRDNEQLIPTLRGAAFITADATLVLDERDPFRYGLS